MFEVPDIELNYSLGVLAIEKILYDYLGEIVGIEIDGDYIFETLLYAFDLVSNRHHHSYNEYSDVEITKIQFPAMQEFYNLCREYGRKHRISFEKNPYIKDTENYVDSEMRSIGSYSIGWSLFTPKKITDKKWPCLVIFTDNEFYQPVYLIEALCNIRDYYIKSVEKLKKELEEHKAQIIQITPNPIPISERNAA